MRRRVGPRPVRRARRMPRPRRSSRSHRARSASRPSSRRAARQRIDGQPCARSPQRFCPRSLTRVPAGSIIHHMMSSSSDELLRSGVEPAIDVENLRVVRGKRVALDDISVQIARGTITGLLGPSGCGKTTLMRSIVGTQIVAAGTVTVLGHPAGSADLRHRVGYVTQNPTIYDDLRVIDNVRYFAALYGTDADGRRRSDRRRRPRRSPNRVVRQPFRRPAHPGLAGLRAGVPPRPAGARRAHGRPRPRAAGRPVGTVPPTRPTRHHAAGVQPRHGRGRPLRRPAAHARRPPARAHHTRPSYERTPDVSHWRKRFCPSSGTAPQPESRSRLSPQAYLATTGADPAPACRRPPQRRDDPRGAQPDHHADVLHVPERAAPPGRAVAVQQRVPDHARRLPADRDVPDHVDHHAAGTGFGNAWSGS